MFAALCAAVCLAPAADPAPLPDRWRLQLLPDGLPQLPDRLYDVTWHDGLLNSRLSSAYWEVWVDFRRAARTRPAEAVVTLAGGRLAVPPRTPLAPGHRWVPLAVHGPLVEFDRRLYTAAIFTGKPGRDPELARDRFHLGSAVEFKAGAWYQAGTTTPRDGKPVVEEWRLEFKDDPRKAAAGAVRTRGRWRAVAESEGGSFDAELRFTAKGPDDLVTARIVTLVPPDGKEPPRPLPYLVIGDRHRWGADVIVWTDEQDRMALSPAPADALGRRPEPPGLVQPPAPKPGK